MISDILGFVRLFFLPVLSRILIVEESPLMFVFSRLASYKVKYVEICRVKLYIRLGVLCWSLMLNVCKGYIQTLIENTLDLL